MSDKELNIKSSTIEKGLDLAKDFLGKLIFPAVEEVGLLMGDNIKVWRFKNQIRLLNNVEKYVKEKNVSTKKIPLKILLPLLENASLEEEPLLNEMWENLLINYIDSSKTLQSNVFPKMLTEISSREARFLLNVDGFFVEKGGLQNEYRVIPHNHDIHGIEDPLITKSEVSNLIRLGILKEINYFSEGGGSILASGYIASNFGPTYTQIGITELGEEFIKSCYKK